MLGIKILLLSLIVSIITGCGKTEEEKQFHQQLLDKALNDETKQMGNRFLAENAQRDDVVVTDSGLQYEILVAAEGPKPRVFDRVRVNYTGWTVDGEVFESSASQTEYPMFTLNKVIKGWRLALLKMSPGARWKVYLPSELAYGARSPGGMVPANSALIFEIELLEILPEEKADQ
ncbi:FKBP-type peptidyl-prolyl cis-trans isomerase [Amphritea sp. 1_MG-2023]|uniref:FKBP-type peptidyl-prolyl cis-trans isomerase n=1 Tax=Amphritea sp. 1_MG-2023 TaxID=3062670 RepID=UPI0026E23413|nr:FKBP-type peptidyl-prolyl cis-trans isomerase [Amphritea sp. 1_MG-2023]MDO6561806.1 FKBP-type peptidyl-prolyl cis-trans isomerase [Amphritea sp. 1_MG-2023]